MGIVISRALDTIKQREVLEVLSMAGCNDDDLRLVKALLANTCQSQRHTAWFKSPLGPFKVIHCPRTFHSLLSDQSKRAHTGLTPQSQTWEHADDVDFANEERDPLDIAFKGMQCT